MRLARLAAALAFALAGCAVMPEPNPRLDEARLAAAALDRDEDARRLAPRESENALEALRRADEAWRTLQDPALVDHLAYVAKQRAAIAVATAQARRR